MVVAAERSFIMLAVMLTAVLFDRAAQLAHDFVIGIRLQHDVCLPRSFKQRPSLFLEAGFLGLFAEGRGRAHGGRIGSGFLERKQDQSNEPVLP